MAVTTNTRKLAALLGASGAGIGTDGLMQAAAVDTNVDARVFPHTTSTSNPALNTNPSATGHVWYNKTTGQSFICTDATGGANVWKNTNADRGGIGPAYVISWLVIGGGGSGGGFYRSGGGGAGGYRNSYNSEMSGDRASSETAWTVTPGTTGAITVVVGAGGAVVQQTTGNTGASGGNSSITAAGALAAGTTPISSTGGGGGGAYGGAGGGGGSGGGGGLVSNTVVAGGTGVAKQGGDGGGVASNTTSLGGCGGGAAGNGNNGGHDDQRYAGQGLFSAITGFDVQRAAGGGSGGYSPGGMSRGGLGGGGEGGNEQNRSGNVHFGGSGMLKFAQDAVENFTAYYMPTNGVDYTGSGGGGNAGNYVIKSNHVWWPNKNMRPGWGGIGTVILRMPTVSYSGVITGSPIVTQVGTDTVLQFVGGGTYTT